MIVITPIVRGNFVNIFESHGNAVNHLIHNSTERTKSNSNNKNNEGQLSHNGPRDALSTVHTSNNVEATFDFVAKNGNDVKRVYRKISSFRQSRMLLQQFVSTLSKGRNFVRLCRKNRSTCSIRQCCLDIVAGVDGALCQLKSC